MLEFLECIISDSLDIQHVWYFLILFIKCLIPGLGRSPGEGKCYPFQYSDLEESMGCIIHGVAESGRIEWLSLSLSSQAQLCQKLWNPVDCSPTGSSVPGILRAKILQWVVIFFSKWVSRPGIDSASFVSVVLQEDSLALEPQNGVFYNYFTPLIITLTNF